MTDSLISVVPIEVIQDRRDMFTVREAMADFISNLNSRADATPVRTGGMDLDD